MSLFGLFGALGTLLLLGGGLSALLLARKGVINLAEWICLSWLFGVCAISLLLWLGGFLMSGAVLQSFVGAMAIVSAALGRRALARFQPAIRIPKPHGIVEWGLAVFLVAEIATICVVSFKHSLGWDGLLIWELKARYAFLNGGVLPAAYFQGIGRSFSHLDYPLAIPFTQLWLYLWLGEANQFWAKVVFPIFYSVGAVLLALLGQRITGRRWIGLVLAVILFFVPQASLSSGSAVVGYADFPLAIYYLAAVGYLLCALRSEDRGVSAPIFAACLACLPWIKNEGTILWAVLAGSTSVLILTGRIPRRYFFALCPGLLVAAAWRVFLHAVHMASISDFLPINRETMPSNLARLPAIYRVILSEVSSRESWGLFWVAAGLTLLFLAFRWRYLTERLLLVFTVIPIGLYSGIYVLSAWQQYLDHVASSVPRLLMQLVPVTLLGLGIVLAEIAPGARPSRGPAPDTA
jgi:general stress protein CsbA